jgi:CDP-diacylglycerol--serine O-phosphatidyltransferase
MKKSIPNIITAANLFSGCLSVVLAFNGQLAEAGILILTAAFLDFFDGLAARLLNVASPIGKEYDSLADVVSFGFAPSVIVYQLLINSEINIPHIEFAAFIMTIFSAYRLAKFNLDERQTSSFIGVPTPANALFWLSIPLIAWQAENSNSIFNASVLNLMTNPYFILVGIIIWSLLMVSEIPLFALKFKSFKWKDNRLKFSFVGISIALIAVFYFIAVPIILILYIILSVINNSISKKHEI